MQASFWSFSVYHYPYFHCFNLIIIQQGKKCSTAKLQGTPNAPGEKSTEVSQLFFGIEYLWLNKFDIFRLGQNGVPLSLSLT